MRNDALRWVTLESKVLSNNPQKDPCTRTFPVYTPPGYNSNVQYPVFYYLSGWGSSGASLLQDRKPFSKNFSELLDEQIQKEEISPFLVVFPDCTTKLGSSQYIDSEGTGKYMTYLCDEVVPWIDQQFSTFPSNLHRGVLGHSSGGFGALVTGMLRGDTFSHVTSFAGDSYFQYLYQHSLIPMIRVFDKYGSFEKVADLFLNNPNPLKNFSRDFGETIMTLNMCQCYLPNPTNPLQLDLYFDPFTGELKKELWEKLLQWDPIHMLDSQKDNVANLSSISLHAGSQDEYGIQLGHRQISKKLKKYKIPHHFEEFTSGHSGYYYRYVDGIRYALSFMSEV